MIDLHEGFASVLAILPINKHVVRGATTSIRILDASIYGQIKSPRRNRRLARTRRQIRPRSHRIIDAYICIIESRI